MHDKGDKEYQTWEGWKRAAKAAGATYINGDRQGLTEAWLTRNGGIVGDWDGSRGIIDAKYVRSRVRANPSNRRKSPERASLAHYRKLLAQKGKFLTMMFDPEYDNSQDRRTIQENLRLINKDLDLLEAYSRAVRSYILRKLRKERRG